MIYRTHNHIKRARQCRKKLTPDAKRRAEKLLELIISGDASDEAQEEFDKLMTPGLLEKFAEAFLAISSQREGQGQDE
jgi:vacuolar-type H+-ATPase subunit H